MPLRARMPILMPCRLSSLSGPGMLPLAAAGHAIHTSSVRREALRRDDGEALMTGSPTTLADDATTAAQMASQRRRGFADISPAILLI